MNVGNYLFASGAVFLALVLLILIRMVLGFAAKLWTENRNQSASPEDIARTVAEVTSAVLNESLRKHRDAERKAKSRDPETTEESTAEPAIDPITAEFLAIANAQRGEK